MVRVAMHAALCSTHTASLLSGRSDAQGVFIQGRMGETLRFTAASILIDHRLLEILASFNKNPVWRFLSSVIVFWFYASMVISSERIIGYYSYDCYY